MASSVCDVSLRKDHSKHAGIYCAACHPSHSNTFPPSFLGSLASPPPRCLQQRCLSAEPDREPSIHRPHSRALSQCDHPSCCTALHAGGRCQCTLTRILCVVSHHAACRARLSPMVLSCMILWTLPASSRSICLTMCICCSALLIRHDPGQDWAHP